MVRPSRSSFALVAALGLTSLGLLHCLGEDVTQAGVEAPAGNGDGGADGTSPIGNDGGGTVDAAAPEPLLDDAVAVSAGRAHTCALTFAGDVLCWGSNASGQLGVPPAQVQQSSRPIKVALGGTAKSVAAGGAHTCIVMTDGTPKCWGANDRGQLGRGEIGGNLGVGDVVPPSDAALKPGWTKKADYVTAGASFTCAAVKGEAVSNLQSRRFFCWGENVTRQSGVDGIGALTAPSLITQIGSGSTALIGFDIATGDDFACAEIIVPLPSSALITSAGCWGAGGAGQLGGASPTAFDVNPMRAPRIVFPDAGTALVQATFADQLFAAGGAHACYRYVDGATPLRLTCWGNNTKGQTGSSTAGTRTLEKVTSFDATGVTALAAGGQVTCVVDSGQVKCVGANELGQLGRGTVDGNVNASFAAASLPPTASAISVGTNHACAVLGGAAGAKGQVACWGQNQNGQLGDGMDPNVGYPGAPAGQERVRSTPVRVLAAK